MGVPYYRDKMKNTLDNKTNKLQALLKLEIAKDNLFGAAQALSKFGQPKISKALEIVEEVILELEIERKENIPWKI